MLYQFLFLYCPVKASPVSLYQLHPSKSHLQDAPLTLINWTWHTSLPTFWNSKGDPSQQGRTPREIYQPTNGLTQLEVMSNGI